MARRPEQFVTETCWTCKRPDWKHGVLYHLRTQDEYAAMMNEPIKPERGVPADFEMMWPSAGSEIHRAVAEAIKYCADYKVPGAAFVFNEKLVMVTANSNADEKVRDWWKRVYKETPEQSRARR